MKALEEKIKKEIYENQVNELKWINIDLVSIDSKNEIVEKVIELLERHKYASIH